MSNIQTTINRLKVLNSQVDDYKKSLTKEQKFVDFLAPNWFERNRLKRELKRLKK